MGEIEENALTYKVKKPVQVVMQPSKEGTSMAFIPFLMFADEFESGIEFKKEDILCVLTPMTDLLNQYSQTFGTGIQIASASTILR